MLRAIVLLWASTCVYAGCVVWQQLPVKLFNDAEVRADMLAVARDEAAWLLRAVCVEVRWILCPVVSMASMTVCAAPANSSELHLLSGPLTSDIAADAMGLAMPGAGARGRAAVFLSRVRGTVEAEPGIVGLPRLLGHVIAHEIGHLLLRSSTHSSEGLMRAGFGRPDLKKAAQRRLTFTPEQADLIVKSMPAK